MITTAELAAMEATQVSAMGDRCKLMAPTGVSGDYGQEAVTYADGSEIVCGFEPASTSRSVNLAGVAIESTARLRLKTSDAGSLSTNHRVKITKRNGTALSPVEVYRCAGWSMRGPSCTVVNLERVS